MKDEMLYNDLRSKYDLLSKRINKFIQWVEDNWNVFPARETATRNWQLE
jgi:hypothetical protein